MKYARTESLENRLSTDSKHLSGFFDQAEILVSQKSNRNEENK